MTNGMGPIQYDGIGLISTATKIRTHPSWHHAAFCSDCAEYDGHNGWNPVWMFANKRRDNSTGKPTDPGETRIARWCRQHENARRRAAKQQHIPEEDVILDTETSTLITKLVLEVIIQFKTTIQK